MMDTVQMPSSSICEECRASWCTRHNERDGALTVSSTSLEHNLPGEPGPELNLSLLHQCLLDWWHGTRVEYQVTLPFDNCALVRPNVSGPRRAKRLPCEAEELDLWAKPVRKTKADETCVVTSTSLMVFPKTTPHGNKVARCNEPMWCWQSLRRVKLSRPLSIAKVVLHRFLTKFQERHQKLHSDVCGNHLDSTLHM